MAKIDIRDQISFPLDVVYPAFRDQLKEVAPYLPNVQSIEVTSYERVSEQLVKVVNLWRAANSDIPKVASAFIKPEMLQWTDYATWDDTGSFCEWKMVVGFLPEAVSCSGKTTYKQVGERTEVHIQGELTIDARKIPGVPRLMAGTIGGAVESFVVKMITPNLKETNRAMEQHLKKIEA